MSKNVELLLNNDYKESFSNDSEDENEQKEIDIEDIETEDQKKNRISLENALKSNNFTHSFEKIESKIASFCSKIQILQDYNLCLGSKLDNKQKGEDIEKIILETGDEISETFNLIEIVKNFEYDDRNKKIHNIQLANNLEDNCNSYNEKFHNLVNDIKKQNLNLINQARNSIRFSNVSNFSCDLKLNTPKKNKSDNSSDKKILNRIEIKKKQNNAINKATRKIERSISKRLTLNKINTNDIDKDDSLENFNIDDNFKKNNELIISESKEYSTNYLTKKSSTDFHDMENKVFIALEGQQQSFIKRHWLIILIIIVFILIAIYYIVILKQK